MQDRSAARINQEVLNWLHNVLQPDYRNVQRTFDDVAEVLIEFRSLRPKTDVYTYEDGRSSLLLLIHGTLPVRFRESSYNIPLNVWIPQEYPQRPPIIFIVPSAGMSIRPGNYVDQDRRCYHPYLAYWSADIRKSVLVMALRALQAVFEKEPPVYTLPRGGASLDIAGANAHRPRPLQDHPPSRQPSMEIGPPVPPKNASNPSPRPADEYNRQSVMPAAPVLQAKPREWANGATAKSPIPSVNPRNPIWVVQQSSPIQMNDATSPQEDLLSQDLSSRATGIAGPDIPTRPIVSQIQDAISSAIEQKALSKQQEYQAQISSLRKDVNTMHSIEDTLNNAVAQLSRIGTSSTNNARALRERTEKAKDLVRHLETMGIPDIDECLVAQNVVYNQLYDLVTSNMALQDTLYTLGKAVENERIGLDAFLKYVKVLSREQFMHRALIVKICSVSGLQC